MLYFHGGAFVFGTSEGIHRDAFDPLEHVSLAEGEHVPPRDAIPTHAALAGLRAHDTETPIISNLELLDDVPQDVMEKAPSAPSSAKMWSRARAAASTCAP